MSSPLPSLSAVIPQVYVSGKIEKILAHVNSLENERGRAYEASNPKTMLQAMAESIRTFPMGTLEPDELESLASIFSEASSVQLGNPEVQKALAQKIKEGRFVVIPAYLVGHCLYLVFGAGFYAVCNRGKGLEGESSTI